MEYSFGLLLLQGSVVHKHIVLVTALDQVEAMMQVALNAISLVEGLNLAHVLLLTQFNVLLHVVHGVSCNLDK